MGTDRSEWQRTELVIGEDGAPLVPGTPGEARARLALLQSDPAIVEVLLDPRHPQHVLRTAERCGLETVAAKGHSAEVAVGEAERRRQVAIVEQASAADLAGRLDLFREFHRS